MPKKKAFTLTELLIVIVVVSILWTISFLSFQWYSSSARNGVRISDLNNIIDALKIYSLDNGWYTQPSDGVDITFSWTKLWTQWTIGETVIINLDKLPAMPLDPLTWNEYTYSRWNTNKDFEVSAVLEWKSVSYNPIVNQANAILERGTVAYVKWDYNWQISKVYSWSHIYVLAIPSIITWNISITDIDDIISSDSLVYNSFVNLPHSYYWSVFEMWKWFDYNPNKFVVFSWNENLLKTDESQRLLLLKNIQDNYTNTILVNSPWISTILDADINLSNPSEEAKSLAIEYVQNYLKMYVKTN